MHKDVNIILRPGTSMQIMNKFEVTKIVSYATVGLPIIYNTKIKNKQALCKYFNLNYHVNKICLHGTSSLQIYFAKTFEIFKDVTV